MEYRQWLSSQEGLKIYRGLRVGKPHRPKNDLEKASTALGFFGDLDLSSIVECVVRLEGRTQDRNDEISYWPADRPMTQQFSLSSLRTIKSETRRIMRQLGYAIKPYKLA